MRPRQGPSTIRLCEAQTFRDPDFPRLQTRPGGKATTAEGRKTQGRRVAGAGAGDWAKSAAAVTESGFWVLLSLFVEETLRGAIAIDDDPADLLSRNSGSHLTVAR